MVSEQIVYAFGWASWSSIFAGAAAAVAVSIIMAILGVALGFTVVRPKSDEPTHGLGVAFGAWGFISILVSLAVGGFIAGFFSGQRGPEHGFIVWAVVTIAATFFSSMAVGTAIRAIGSVVRGIGSGAASVGSGVADVMGAAGKSMADMASNAIDEIRNNVSLNLDTDKFNDTVISTLRDTGVETLQPEYLKQQMREAKSDLRASLHQLSMNPSNLEQIALKFMDTEKRRLAALTNDFDKEAAIKAVMAKRGIPQQEAEELVDTAINAYDHTVEKAKETLAEAKDQVQEAKLYLAEMAEQAREKAARAASMAAKTALAATAALVLAAVVSMGAGYWGAGTVGEWYTVQSTYTIR